MLSKVDRGIIVLLIEPWHSPLFVEMLFISLKYNVYPKIAI